MKILSAFVFALLLLISSCNEDPSELAPVEFEFRLLNEQGVPSTVFNSGENFVFSFSIVNSSDDELWLQSSFDTEDFFRVHHLYDQEETIYVNMGKPYTSIFCENIAGYFIAPGDTFSIERPWNVPDSIRNEFKEHYDNSIVCGFEEKPRLFSGVYRTGFNSSFTFINNGGFFKNGRTVSTQVKEFEITFEYVMPLDPVESAKAILGKWELIERGHGFDLEPAIANGYDEYLPDSVVRSFEYAKNRFTYQQKYWIDSLLHKGVYRDDGYFFNVTYKYEFFENNNKLRLDLQALAIFNTFIFKRIE